MRKLLPAIILLAACLLLSPASASAFELTPRWFEPLAVTPSSLTEPPIIVPVAGPTRIETAIEASKLAFPGTADTFVLCTAWNWPDALGGSALAGAVDGPLLLTAPGALSPQVAAEAARLDAHDAIIIGSEKAVSAEVELALKALYVNGHRLSVTRIGGVDRFETSAMVASATVDEIRSGGTYDGTAFFATGRNFPDALAASPLAARKGWPVLLVEPSALPNPTEGAITRLGVTRGIILGSDNAVGGAVASRLATLLPVPPERLQGPERYSTALEIARFAVAEGLSWDGVAITTGENFPDALAGGVMQGRLGSVVLLTPTTYLRQSVFDQLALQRAEIDTVRYLGTTSAVRQFARDGVYAALTGGIYCPPNWMTFPVAGPCNYTDTFGAPRSGGRTHEGTDIMAARGTPCVAVLAGTVTTRVSTLGGNTVYLDADNGWRFYYAHLDGWAVTTGQHVSAGQTVGYVGNSGNASGGATHLHFQMWKPDGTLLNPYTYLLGMLR